MTTLPSYQEAKDLDNVELLRRLGQDRALASSMLFGHRHPQATPGFHVSIMDLWRGADEFLVIEAFREAGKSTLSEEFLLLEACFGNFKYGLIFGETWTKACQRLAAIKHEIKFNDRLRALFGSMESKPWSDDAIVLSNGVRLEAHGWEEEIRGYKWLDSRPDRAYLDDIENKTMVSSTEQVDKSWRKLNTELIPALDRMNRKVRITGTPLGDDCLLARAESDPAWIVAKFPQVVAPNAGGNDAVDHPLAKSLWPERYPLSEIRKERDRFANGGLLREWVQEYQLIAAQTQGKPFVEDEIRYEALAPMVYAPRAFIVDPARTTNVNKSDRTGRVVCSRVGTRIYVHESSGEYWKPDQVVADCFDTSARHDDCEVFVERNSLDEWLMQPIRTEMMRRGHSLPINPVLAPSDRSKEQFILGLQPWFKAGDIVLVGGKSKHTHLVQEILNFPSGKRDVLNALAYAQRVFGGEAMYGEFGQDNIVSLHTVDASSELLLGLHATMSETCGVLLEVDGRHLTVLADFTSALAPGDAVADIMTVVRAAYPKRRVTVYVPAEDDEQRGRVPLMDALRAAYIPAFKGSYISSSRGCLADSLRTTYQGRRMLRVVSNCRATLRALASGYRKPIGKDGRGTGEPEKGVSRTLMEALEPMVHAVLQGAVANQLPDGFGSARNAQGVQYLSALRR